MCAFPITGVKEEAEPSELSTLKANDTVVPLHTACTCECALPYTLTWFLLEQLLCPKSQDTIELSLSVREHWRTPCQALPPGGSASSFSWLPQWTSPQLILMWQTGAANRTCEVPTLKLLYHCACARVDLPVPILQNIIVMISMVPFIILVLHRDMLIW